MTQREYLDLQSLYESEGRSAASEISGIVSGKSTLSRNVVFAMAYVLIRANSDDVSLSSIEAFCESIGADVDRKGYLESYLSDYWNFVSGLRYRYAINVLKSIILFHESRDERFGDLDKTPIPVARLACRLFDFEDKAEVADFCFGSGAFATEAYLSNPSLRFYGVETNADIKEMSAIRFEILGCSLHLEHGNMLDLDADQHQYQYIFSNYPFGLKLRDLGFERNRLLQRVQEKTQELNKNVSSDWFFNAAIVECLRENGKGIAVMTNGSTWNSMDRSARKYFVENGYLEAVIALPERLFEGVAIPTTMVVLSKNNERTMLVDATGLCEKGRRFNTFKDEQIEQIVYATTHETENSKFVSQEEFAENDYVLHPTRHLTEQIVVEDGVPFETVIKSITRGAQLKASELDEMISEEPTDYQYLMLANIQHGQIDDELPYLKDIQKNQLKYCLTNHALIISKNGAPFKIAVAEVQHGKTILANGNLYIIELDEEKVDPYYVKAFLESEKGTALLKSVAVGAALPNISVEALRNLPIPQAPLEEQHAMATKYLVRVDEIKIYRRKLQKALEALEHIYDNKE